MDHLAVTGREADVGWCVPPPGALLYTTWAGDRTVGGSQVLRFETLSGGWAKPMISPMTSFDFNFNLSPGFGSSPDNTASALPGARTAD